jgi:hypothetical protein
MFEKGSNLIYLEVTDGIVTNRLLGSPTNPLTAENLFIEDYPVKMGWKQINQDTFIPSEMSEEEWTTLVNNTKEQINSTKQYYDNLVNSSHYQNNLSEEVKEQVQDFISRFNVVHEKINEHDGWILEYMEHEVSYREPFFVRPNIENEV